jgi:ubiquinone/menaquinone biosynthesis C-methylase UbiE
MKYDSTDIHLRYNNARKLPDDTMTLWMDKILKHIPINGMKTIIDLGCGTGRFLNVLTAYSQGTILGLDPSSKMISKAKKTLNRSKGSLIQTTAEYICLDNDSVDLVFLSQTYHHFKDKNMAILEIRRILRKNGFFCIRNSVIENLDTCLYLKFFPTAYKDDHLLLPSRNEVKNSIMEHNFKIVSHSVVNYKVADDLKGCYEKSRLRGTTDLALLPDNKFYKGLKEFELYCKENESKEPVFEEMDLFICKKI